MAMRKYSIAICTLCLMSLLVAHAQAQGFTDESADLNKLPSVADGFRIELVASEPLVRNPCSMAFDHRGRLFVGMGPQYRRPKPDTPGDSVMLLVDSDGDGRFDKRHEFARGLNNIQGMAWHGDDLWLANAPDLTIVRDTDGDDVADEYVKMYTDLGNIEHALHGLVWGPDGRLYMSKGNSKGLTKPGRIAPKAFRELWDVASPEGSPEIPPPQTFTAANYKSTFQDPNDDWGREGGVLVCDPDGKNLEIVSRGFRNPWDINIDDRFNFQGTDNDQNEGDRIFEPFRGSHYGWGHSWSASWTGQDHLPTAPITGKVFHGSGTGIVFYNATQFPESYRGVWFFNDWLRKTTFMYRPRFDGGTIQPVQADWVEFVTGGDALFRPTDIEVGPDGHLYILGWGTEYGVKWDADHKMVNEGRVYKVFYNGTKAVAAKDAGFAEVAFQKPFVDWKAPDLINVFASSIPARRVAAQQELLRRGPDVVRDLLRVLDSSGLAPAVETWAIWTLGRIVDHESVVDSTLLARSPTKASPWLASETNQVIQSLRVLAYRSRDEPESATGVYARYLESRQPRVRLAALLAIQEAAPHIDNRQTITSAIQKLVASETDRVVFYAAWQALRRLQPTDYHKRQLVVEAAGERLAALLALAEDRELTDEEVLPLIGDEDERVRSVAALWMARRNGNSLLVFHPPSQEFDGELEIDLTPGIKPADVRYTTDGSTPTIESTRWDDVTIDRTTEFRVALFAKGHQVGPVAIMNYRRISESESSARSGVMNPVTSTGKRVRVGRLEKGAGVYVDRGYEFESVDGSLQGLSTLRLANEDAGSRGESYLSFGTVTPLTVYVGHDTRIGEKPKWLVSSESDFEKTPLRIITNDAEFEVYQANMPAGSIQLGGNSTDGKDGSKSNYIVALRHLPLPTLAERATLNEVLAKLPTANVDRGKALFYGGGACSTCHRTDDSGLSYGPDLGHLVSRNDPRHVALSILDPNAQITEGFAELAIETDSGQTITGLLRAETDTGLTLIQKDGKTRFIQRTDVADRSTLRVSPMPVFADLLNAQHVADLTAWLLLAAVNDDAAEDASALDPTKAKFSVEQQADRLNVRLNGKPFGSYVFRHKKLSRPGWIGIHSHTGVQVTRDFPATGDDADHQWMHPGIWLSFGHLNGQDYWRMKAETRHEEFVERPTVDGNRLTFSVRNSYLAAENDNERVCREVTAYVLTAEPDGVRVRVASVFDNPDADFYFGDQEEGGLAFRMTPELSVKTGNGTILNSQGDRNGDEVWGKQTQWVDYSGVVEGRHVGILVRPHETNARQCWMHARDYGVVACNPFPKQPKQRRAPYTKTWVRKGDVYRLGYDVFIHDTVDPFDPTSEGDSRVGE